MFVSMECVFSGFDYAVVAPNDDNHIVARTNDTAFLSRHLRAYGGTGEYQGHKVGRLLKNITLQKRVKNFFVNIKCPSSLKLYIDVDPINFV